MASGLFYIGHLGCHNHKDSQTNKPPHHGARIVTLGESLAQNLVDSYIFLTRIYPDRKVKIMCNFAIEMQILAVLIRGTLVTCL